MFFAVMMKMIEGIIISIFLCLQSALNIYLTLLLHL